MYRVIVERKPSKFFEDKKIPLHIRVRTAEAIEELKGNPRRGNKHLKGEYYCFWRRRVGRIRVIFRIFDKEKAIKVVEICWREACY